MTSPDWGLDRPHTHHTIDVPPEAAHIIRITATVNEPGSFRGLARLRLVLGDTAVIISGVDPHHLAEQLWAAAGALDLAGRDDPDDQTDQAHGLADAEEARANLAALWAARP